MKQMNLFKKLLFLGLLTCICTASTIANAQNIEDRRYVCMMQDSLQVKPGTPIEIDGKTYFGCCSMCAGKMKGEPKKYTMAKDPITGTLVDKSTAFIFGHEGQAYYFESEKSRAQFGKNPQNFVKPAVE